MIEIEGFPSIPSQPECQEVIDALVSFAQQSGTLEQRGGFYHLAGNTAFQGFLGEQKMAGNPLLFLRRQKHTRRANIFLFQAPILFSEAIDYFSKTQDYKSQASALCNRAICLQLIGKGHEAAEDFQRALKLSPSDKQRQRLRESGARYSLRTE